MVERENKEGNNTAHNIVFFHPDLGIGGAERLVIDAAVGLQSRGHKVTIFTSHCDPAHCFDEARNGTLDVRVRGNAVIPPSILGRFAILCAILRQLHLILQITILSSELAELKPTSFVVDQLSAGIPLLRYLYPDPRVLFYCHFPDKLLAKKGGLLKSLYRGPFDFIESWSTGCSDGIVVNSKFTRGVFEHTFPSLKHREPRVIYPCVDTAPAATAGDVPDGNEKLWKDKQVVLSINRFERKKDVGLAIKAFAGLSAEVRKNARLVIAGGYDPRNAENASYHLELSALADSLKLKHATVKTVVSALAIPTDISILFLLSVPNSLKSTLLSTSSLLVYTPRNEHFGIVPLEAMLAGIPVLAANEGGPTETVVEGETGWLRDVSKVADWTAVMRRVLSGQLDTKALHTIGENGKKRVTEMFSKEMMAKRFEEEINGLRDVDRPILVDFNVLLAVMVVVLAAFAFVLRRIRFDG
ncbi:alpha-1,3-mannosyltransferas-like protein ALG2 [Tothia fuscella]|uniref:Alpha-1,3/1,6-mannosyltransferase ALG2 n=1 Tax=Tothia fuscella TaxID=1048955 RepID=A0A9P4NPL0_9PEZI|nr:alpha-1,3-mannosyltransferas-like protein ALG2 [Tothia fuscella]